MTALSLVAAVLGVGLLAFWGWGLGAGGLTSGPEPWPGFRDHELAFAVPDVLVGVALLAVAAQVPGAASLAWACAGALAFLGFLDAAYLARTWAQRDRGMRWRTGAVVVCCLGGALVLAALAGRG